MIAIQKNRIEFFQGGNTLIFAHCNYDSFCIIEPPSAPRNLYVTDILSTSALLKWKNPEKLGTGDDLAYEIRYGYNVRRTKHLYLSLTGLKRLTYYSATVVAVNNVTYAINKRNGVTVYFKTKSGCK